jgi:hypothetical protein
MVIPVDAAMYVCIDTAPVIPVPEHSKLALHLLATESKSKLSERPRAFVTGHLKDDAVKCF